MMPAHDSSPQPNPVNNAASTGHHYSLLEITAIASAFVLATIALNLMPLLIGAAMSILPLTEAGAGALTTSELLIMSATTFLLAPWAPRLVGRYLIVAAVCLAVIAHASTLLATTTESYSWIRALAGFAAGLLLLGANTRVASSHDPVRLYGICTVSGATIAMLLFGVLPSLMSEYGALALFVTLAALGLVIAPLQGFFPKTISTAHTQTNKPVALPLMLFILIGIALFTIQLTMASFFAFVERMAINSHEMTPESLGAMLSAALLAGMLGSALATWLGERWGQLLPLVLGLSGHGLATFIACTTEDANLFNASVMAQALFYFFSIPFQLGLAAQLDSSGRLANVAAAVYFLGMSCGPILGGWLVETWHYGALAWAVTLGVVLSIAILAHLIKRYVHNRADSNDNLDKSKSVLDT